MRTLIRSVLFVLLLGPVTGLADKRDVCSSEADILQQASRNIERFRKADATIKFISPEGTTLRAARVEVRQTSHDFLFGNVIRYRHFNNPEFQRRFKELFNFATLLEFNWAQYEPMEAQTRRQQRMQIARWCQQNQITTNGHMLVWTRASGVPEWLIRYEDVKRYELLKARVENVVADYTGMIDSWVVVNEPINIRVWGNWDAPEGKKDERIEAIVPYVHDAYVWSRQANPKANLILNEYNIIASETKRQRFIELVRELQKRQTPISAIGIQAHEPDKGRYWYSLEHLWETYDHLGHLGYPLYVTEFIPQSSGKPITGRWREGVWTEQTQAEYAELFYRVGFGHQAVVCIVWFGLADDDVWKPGGGVLDEQYQPKKVFDTLKHLIHNEWNTRVSGELRADGVFRFRGFYGRYNVRLYTSDGREFTFKVHLQRNQKNNWTMILPAQEKGG